MAAVDPSYYESDEREFETSVNFVPPSSTMLLSIRDIVKQENLTNVGIIYDQSFSKYYLNLTRLNQNGTTIPGGGGRGGGGWVGGTRLRNGLGCASGMFNTCQFVSQLKRHTVPIWKLTPNLIDRLMV